MQTGLYASASGMIALQHHHEAVANNIANINTPGFKRQVALFHGFYQTFEKVRSQQPSEPRVAPGGGVALRGIFDDFSPGVFRQSGNPLDAAIEDPAGQQASFFVVDTPQGRAYTRSGEFHLDTSGRLITSNGFVVQGTGGPITVRGVEIQISERGEVVVDGAVAGQLNLVRFETPGLVRGGDNLYFIAPDSNAQETPATDATVKNGMVEGSNVSASEEIVNLMLGVRGYEANQRAMRAIDETMERVIDEVIR